MDATKSDSWFRQEKAHASITRLWEPHVHPFFRANIWLVEGRDADLVVDFGMGLSPLVPALLRDRAKPLFAVATHFHADHVGALHEFGDRRGHRLEAEGFAHMDDGLTLAHLFRGIDEPVARLPGPDWRPETFALKKAPLTSFLDEGSQVSLGDFRFEVLHLPGHSPGSIGLWESGRRLLISGDAIYSGSLVDDLPGSNIEHYLQTMDRLAGLDVDVVYPGHNEPISGDEMRAIAAGYVRTKRGVLPGAQTSSSAS